MKVVHVCLCGPFTDGMGYQENELVEQHVRANHEVTVLAGLEVYGSNGTLNCLPPGEARLGNGAIVKRLPYLFGLNNWMLRKIRKYDGFYQSLVELSPDVIMFHGFNTWELIAATKYVRHRPHVILKVDSHAEANNSGRGLLSRVLLHGCYYKYILRSALPYVDRLYYLSTEVGDFTEKVYGVSISSMEFLPLGGEIWSDQEYAQTRERVRQDHGWEASDIVFLQSGKIDKKKRLDWTLKAINRIEAKNVRLVIVGHLMDDVEASTVSQVNSDERIQFVGWKSSVELRELLCAADVYVQPGTQSATMQMALCSRCAVILADHKSHQTFVSENGYIVADIDDLVSAFKAVVAGGVPNIMAMSQNSAALADRMLDYRKQARKILEK